MRRQRVRRSMAVVLFGVAGAVAGARAVDPGAGNDAGRADQGVVRSSTITALLQVAAVEDTRAVAPAALDLLRRAAAGAPDAEVQRAAVRALGRLERPDLLPHLETITATTEPAVRAEVANAMAQAVFGGDGAQAAPLLLARLAREGHPLVRGVVAASLGRLALGDGGLREQVAAALLDTGWPTIDGRRRPASPAVLLGVLRGVESFAARHRELQAGATDLAAAVRGTAFPDWTEAHAAGGPPRAEPSPAAMGIARYRSMTALASVRVPFEGDIAHGLADADPEVRRLAAGALARLEPYHPDHATRALADPVAAVRLQALRALSRRTDGRPSCEQALSASRDPALPVGLLGIELVGGRCRGDGKAEEHLVALLQEVTDGAGERECRPLTAMEWHRPGRALVALAQTGTRSLDPWLRCFQQASAWRARAAAARALGARGEREALFAFFDDDEPNVRTTALELLEPGDPLAVRAALAALDGRDYELLLVAANKLQGATPHPAIAAAVASTLKRVTADEKDTSRDTRLALIERLAEHGDAGLRERIAPLARDFDPVVAERAAGLLSRWTGAAVAPAPRRGARLPLPSPSEFEALGRTRVVMTIDGGEVIVRPLAREAPLNAWRFVRLAREGFYTGLTLHRVVPNFIVQGGSPGANEHSADGPYTRDEVGLQSNARGTMGLSTRGRDTGDGQFYVNLVDNARLDFTYTVFAQVQQGMEVFDRATEGATIERVRVVMEPPVR